MKAAYIDSASVNIQNATGVYKDAARPVFASTGEIIDWVIPKGTVVDGDEAVYRVRSGQAEPIDKECSAACGMSEAQLAVAQRRYQSAVKGIQGEKDYELFMAGVIDGYAPGSTDEKPVYIHGPKWQAFQEAKSAVKQESDI